MGKYELEYEDLALPRRLRSRDKRPRGANCATTVTVYKCFCGFGRLVHSRVPGFDDEWFELKCRKCNKKYTSIIDWCGDELRVYLKPEKKNIKN